MMLDNRQPIRDALIADFGVHPIGLADVIECIGPATRAEWTASQLEVSIGPRTLYNRLLVC